jgi:transposase
LLHHVKEEYGAEYHETYAYDLVKEAGLSPLRPLMKLEGELF